MGSQPSDPQPTGERDERLRSISHDARHALYAVRVGVRLIGETQTGNPDVAQLSEMVARECRTLVECVEGLIQLAKD